MDNQKISHGKANEKEFRYFEEIFRLYYARLIKFAGKFLSDSNEAEDMVQDVFFQIWKNRERLNREKNVSAYLFTLVKNKCLNLLRHKVVEEAYIIQNTKDTAEELYHISFKDPLPFIPMEERLIQELDNIIAKMPPKCGQVFRLKWLEGKKIREIAIIMDISTTMVDKHLAKGLKIARENLDPGLFILLLAGIKTD